MLTTRRQALKTLTAAALGSTALGRIPVLAQTPAAAPAPPAAASTAPTGPFKLPPLPYAYDALEPHIDTETMHLHHDKHHAAYVNKLNEAVAVINADRGNYGDLPLITSETKIDDLLKALSKSNHSDTTTLAVYNQGGGHSNHSLFWESLSPKGGAPKGEFAKALDADLGGLDKFKEAAAKAGAGLFGSGWVWLGLARNNKLGIITTPNQATLFSDGWSNDKKFPLPAYPLLGIDVWEHAYYLKYHNVRADYITAIWKVVNWDFVSDRYATAMKG